MLAARYDDDDDDVKCTSQFSSVSAQLAGEGL